MRNKIENNYPFIITCCITLGYWLYGSKYSLSDKIISSIISNVPAISSTLLGFLLTVLTIIKSLETESLKIIRQAEAFPKLIGYLERAIVFDFITISISLIAEVYIKEKCASSQLFLFLIFLEGYLVMVNFRFINLFIKIIRG